MNRTRRPEYQVQECLRLGFYLGPEGRLYSNEEIAEKLGETVGWVDLLLSPHFGWQSRPLMANIETCPVNMMYDPAPSSRPRSSG